MFTVSKGHCLQSLCEGRSLYSHAVCRGRSLYSHAVCRGHCLYSHADTSYDSDIDPTVLPAMGNLI